MDSITHEGKTYLRAAKIAKELGYTSDYVGQLCREGHVACTRVGRNWFVEEASIRNHKTERKRSVAAKARQSIKKQRQALAQESATEHTPAARYEPDAESLLPTVHKEAYASEQVEETPVAQDTETQAPATHEQVPAPAPRKSEDSTPGSAMPARSHTQTQTVRIQRPTGEPRQSLQQVRPPRDEAISAQDQAAQGAAQPAPPPPRRAYNVLCTILAIALLIVGITPFFVGGKVVVEAGEPLVSNYIFTASQAQELLSNLR